MYAGRSSLPDHKFDPFHFLTSIAIQRGEIMWSQTLHFVFPTGIGDLDAQHSVGKIQCAGALSYNRSARQWPGQDRGFTLRYASQGTDHDLFQSSACRLQRIPRVQSRVVIFVQVRDSDSSTPITQAWNCSGQPYRNKPVHFSTNIVVWLAAKDEEIRNISGIPLPTGLLESSTWSENAKRSMGHNRLGVKSCVQKTCTRHFSRTLFRVALP